MASYVYVDTSNEPRTDAQTLQVCARALARATEPADVAALQCRVGNARMRRGEVAEAEAAFRACVAAVDRADARNNLGLLLLRRHEYAEAAAEFSRGLAAAPDDETKTELWINLGVALEHREPPDAAEARRCYEAAAALAPGDARPRTNLGSLLAAEGDVEGALARQREAAAISPDDPWLRSARRKPNRALPLR
mmetsp:Transcript_17212/g.52923  ORF Transcript_17212/g.52923 Transcript_17212/m.52923 type:complete len:194 (+) Transcript_17212:239-820(+)